METPQKNKVVLVTGGSGFLGQHIVKQLQEKSSTVEEIRVFDLKPYKNKLGHTEKKTVTSYLGDIRQKSELSEAVKGVDVVIHTAGDVGFGNFPDLEKLKNINVKGTENVIDVCIEECVPRLIHCSTVDVVIGYSDILDGDETLSRPQKLIYAEYGGTKADAEELVLQANGTSLKDHGKLRTLSLRPNVMYGQLDPFYVTTVLKMAANANGKVDRVGDGTAKFQQAYVGNVAWAFLAANDALSRDTSVGGQPYFITDDTPVGNPFDFLEPFLEAKGYSYSDRTVPAWLAYWGLKAAETFAWIVKPFKKLELPGTSSSVAYTTRSFYFSRKSAETKLGYKPLYGYKESVDLSMPYYNNL